MLSAEREAMAYDVVVVGAGYVWRTMVPRTPNSVLVFQALPFESVTRVRGCLGQAVV